MLFILDNERDEVGILRENKQGLGQGGNSFNPFARAHFLADSFSLMKNVWA
jgi:hypothetical protein